jgi:DNA adenine methylase
MDAPGGQVATSPLPRVELPDSRVRWGVYFARVMLARRPLPQSPFRYPGGKSWLVPLTRAWLQQRRPSLLIEPFAGSAAVSLAALGEGLVEQIELCELDAHIAAVWRVMLSSDARALAERVRSFEFNDDAVRRVLASSPPDRVELAFRVLLRNRVSRGGIYGAALGSSSLR